MPTLTSAALDLAAQPIVTTGGATSIRGPYGAGTYGQGTYGRPGADVVIPPGGPPPEPGPDLGESTDVDPFGGATDPMRVIISRQLVRGVWRDVVSCGHRLARTHLIRRRCPLDNAHFVDTTPDVEFPPVEPPPEPPPDESVTAAMAAAALDLVAQPLSSSTQAALGSAALDLAAQPLASASQGTLGGASLALSANPVIYVGTQILIVPENLTNNPNDVTFQLNSWFSSLVAQGYPASQPRYFRDGRYRIDFRLEPQASIDSLNNNTTLFTDYDVTSDIDGKRKNYRMIRYEAIRGFTVRRLTIKGPKPIGAGFDNKRFGWHGIEIDACVGFTIEDLTIRDIRGDFVYVADNDNSSTPSTDGIVQRLICVEAGRQGFTVGGAVNNIWFGDSSIDKTGIGAFDLEPPAGTRPIIGVTFQNIDLSRFAAATLSTHGRRINDLLLRDIRHHGKAIRVDCTHSGIIQPDFGPAEFDRITSDTPHDANGEMFEFVNWHDATIHHCVGPEARGHAAIVASGYGSATTTQHDNSFPGANPYLRIV